MYLIDLMYLIYLMCLMYLTHLINILHGVNSLLKCPPLSLNQLKGPHPLDKKYVSPLYSSLLIFLIYRYHL